MPIDTNAGGGLVAAACDRAIDIATRWGPSWT
jgi:hypothetical protein